VSAAAKVLERARAADIRLEAYGRRLAYDAPDNVSPDLLAQLQECKVEILELLQLERRELLEFATDPKARTRCLSALIGTLSPSRVPHRWPAATWPQFIADAQAFCRDWAERAFLSGWAAWELFGCHCRAPWGRIQGMGLVLLLKGNPIAAMTPSEAVIRTRTGARQTYRRKSADPLLPVERCLVWELQDA
jgi:TubC N-terminal docking domain